jgi:hypothetical protein
MKHGRIAEHKIIENSGGHAHYISLVPLSDWTTPEVLINADEVARVTKCGLSSKIRRQL